MVKVLVAISHQTQKAVLCDGAVWNAEKDYYDVNNLIAGQFWLPKSQISEVKKFFAKEFIGEEFLHVVEVPGWLAKKRNLKQYEWDGEIRETPVPKIAVFPSEW